MKWTKLLYSSSSAASSSSSSSSTTMDPLSSSSPFNLTLIHRVMACFVQQDSVDKYTRSLVLVFLCFLVGMGKFVSLLQVVSSQPPTMLTYGIFLFWMQMICIPFFLKRTNNLHLLSHYTLAILYVGVLHSCYYAQGYMVINCTVFPILPLFATFLFGSFRDSFGWCVVLLITNIALYMLKSDWEPGDFPTISQLRDFTFLANIMSMSISAILGGVFNISSNLKQKELERERDKAQELSKIKSEFTANVSHEIRTPLVAVIGLSELLAKDTMLTADQRYLISTIYSASLHLDNLVNNVLNFSKTEANMVQLENTTFDVSELVEETLLYFSAMAESCGIRLLSFADPISTDGLCTVSGDPHRIQQILQNLVANAIKFCSESQQGEVLITLDTVPSKDKRSKLRWYRFSVGDNGIGMSKAGLQKLFMPFSQVDNSTTRRYGGTGLGLVICKQLCTLLGGDIEVDSEESKGTTITFTIPLKLSTEIKSTPHTNQAQTKRGSETTEAAEAAANAAAHAAVCAEQADMEASQAVKSIELMTKATKMGGDAAHITRQAATETAKAAQATKDAALTTAKSAVATARVVMLAEAIQQEEEEEEEEEERNHEQQEQTQQSTQQLTQQSTPLLKKENSQQWKRRKDVETPPLSPQHPPQLPLRTPPLHASSPLRHQHKREATEEPDPLKLEYDTKQTLDKAQEPDSPTTLGTTETDRTEPTELLEPDEPQTGRTLAAKVLSLGKMAKTLVGSADSTNSESEPLLTTKYTHMMKANSFQEMKSIFAPDDSSSEPGTPEKKNNLTRVVSEPSPDWLGNLRSISSPHIETRHSRSKSMGGGSPFSPPFRVIMPLDTLSSPALPTSPSSSRKKLSGGIFVRDKSSMFSPDFHKILTKSQEFWKSSTPLASDLQLGVTGYLDPPGDQASAWDRIRAGMKASAAVGEETNASDAICLIAGSQAAREVLKSMLNFRGLVNTEVMDAGAYAQMMRLKDPPHYRIVIAESDIFACVSASGVRERDRDKEPGSTEGLAEMLDPAAFDPRISTRYILLVSCKYHRYGKYIEFPVPPVAGRSNSDTVKVVFCAENPVRRSSLAQSLLACVAPSDDGIHIAKGNNQLHASSPPQPSRSNLRILLCEDNLVNIEVLTRQLKKLGYTNCDIRHNGAEGLQAFRDKEYDVVLMDCQMPILDGYEATKEIRSLEQHRKAKKRVPIVALTASAMPEERDRGMKSGMDNYLSKPIQLAVLQNLLEGVQTS